MKQEIAECFISIMTAHGVSSYSQQRILLDLQLAGLTIKVNKSKQPKTESEQQ